MEQRLNQNKQQSQVVAVIGAIASGKDELVDYLIERYGVLGIDVGDFARKLEKGAKNDEPHMLYDVSAKKLADYGSEHVIKQLVIEIMNRTLRSQAVVIIGVRTPAEVAALKAHFGSDLLVAYVKVGEQNTRYERTQSRNFSTDPDNFQEFVQRDERLKSDYALGETAVLADITLWNNDSLEAYYQQIETYITPHLFPENQT
jgi:dephospho-CoA kinase